MYNVYEIYKTKINCLVKPPIYKVFVVYFTKTYTIYIAIRIEDVVTVLFWIEIQSNANEVVHFKQKFLVANCYRLVCSFTFKFNNIFCVLCTVLSKML